MALFKSKPEKIQKVSTLRPGAQEDLFTQLLASLQGEGAEGAYGDIADYFRGLMSGEGAEEYEAPLRRQLKEDIIPGIAEQFAGLGAGGLSGSGFAQEAGRASTDLAERLGSIRAGLRQQGAAGLGQLAQSGLTPRDEILFRPRQPSLFETLSGSMAGGLGTAVGTALGGPLGGLFGSTFGNFLKK